MWPTGAIDRAWAVGTKLTHGHTRAYALRASGPVWQERSPATGEGESGLTSVTSTSAGDIWAVGWDQDDSGRLRPLIATVEGSGWHIGHGADLPAGSGALTDVDFVSPREGWSVGYLVRSGSSRHEVMLQRWDGQAWHLEPLPWARSLSAIPRSLDVAANGDIWIAGSVLQEGSGARAFVAHRDPTGWRVHTDVLPADVGSEIFSIAALGDGAIAAGELDSAAIVLVTCNDMDGPSDASGAPQTDRADIQTTRPDPSMRPDPTPAFPPLARPTALRAPIETDGIHITDMASESGLADLADTTKGLAVDLDADGWTDVMYWNHTDAPHFYLGGPEGFRAGPASAFGPLDRHYCSVADVEGDGDPDVFCSSGRRRGRGIGQHELSLDPTSPDGGPAPDIGGVIDPFGRGRATTFIDLDSDGLPDLFVATSPDRGDAMPGMNRFFRNVAGRFVPAPEVGLDRSTGGWCAVAADVDGDGDEDLLHCLDRSDDARVKGLRLYQNDDGQLREQSAALGLEPMRDIAVLAEDLSGDGRIDIAQLNRNKIRISLGTAEGFKSVYSAVVPFAVGMAAGDVNGDGALDLYVVTGTAKGNAPDFLLLNDGSGRAFRSMRIPQAQDGSGSGVMAIDYDHNGLSDFVVLNGNGSFQGTTQLLAAFSD